MIQVVALPQQQQRGEEMITVSRVSLGWALGQRSGRCARRFGSAPLQADPTPDHRADRHIGSQAQSSPNREWARCLSRRALRTPKQAHAYEMLLTNISR